MTLPTITGLTAEDRSLHVTWSDGAISRYPWIWLRDHARDGETVHPVTRQRQLFTARVPRDLRGLGVQLDDDGDVVVVSWDVLETPSHLPVSMLATHRFPRPARAALDVAVTLWNSAVDTPAVPYSEVMATDSGIEQWLGRTLQYGFCIVAGVPPTADATAALARRAGYIRETIFGGLWTFGDDLHHADTAYTSDELRGHTDGTYSNDAPGFQLLHCLRLDASGGESTLVDGFAVARRLEHDHPELFDVLCEVAVPGHYQGEGAHLIAARPVLRHDHTGRLVQISFNNYDRAPFLLDEDGMIRFYDALRAFDELVNDPEMQWRHTLQPGEALLFDNWRVLHGRTAYRGERTMCGAYLNREDVESTLRVLQEQR